MDILIYEGCDTMNIFDKHKMTEEEIKLYYITPAIVRGWNNYIGMENKITDGRINVSGNIANRGSAKSADYILYLNDAKMMDIPFAYSSNGDAFFEHDFLTGEEKRIELDKFPT